MSEHLAHIFERLPEEVLHIELNRIQTLISELTVRRELIEQCLNNEDDSHVE